MASTIATGGAGINFESRVAAHFLGAILCQTTVRGLPQGVLVKKAMFQRSFEGDNSALDDVILEGASPSAQCRLSFQVKRTLTFGQNDLLKEVMADCWKTFSSKEFQPGLDRFGVAVGNNQKLAQQAGRDVLNLAKSKASASEFLDHLAQKKVASNDMRKFAQIVRSALDEAKGSSVTDTELWGFIRHFETLYFDFEQGDSSQSLHQSISALTPALIPSDSGNISSLWDGLVTIADEHKPTAGSLTRDSLIEKLHNRFKLSGLPQNNPDLEKIQTSSRRALDSISRQIGSVHLDRHESLITLIKHSSECDFIEIIGEPGSGKSALLKAFAEIKVQDAPTIVIDAKRLPDTPGLEGLERLWNISKNLDKLISDFSRIERPCLFIDAVDRIENAGQWAIINDLIRCVRQSASGDRWCIIVTARANTVDYRQNLTDDALGKKQGQVRVDLLNASEIQEVVSAYPQLSELVQEEGPAVDLAKRPYMLSRLIKSRKLNTGPQSLNKLTEIDLMLDIWTEDSGKGTPFRTQRQSVLAKLGKALLAGNTFPKAFEITETDALHSLEQDDILRSDPVNGKIEFCHDILEDWVLCICMDDETIDIPTLLQTLDQPLWLVESIQLLGQFYLEKKQDIADWKCLLETVSIDTLDPKWRRVLVTAPLLSPLAPSLLAKIDQVLFSDHAKLLNDLMVALRTTEIFPNTAWYNTQIKIDGLDDFMRRELAFMNAGPRPKAWRPFLVWLVHRINQIPPHLVSELSKVLEVLPRSMGNVPEWLSDYVVDWATDWLEVIDSHWSWNREDAMRERYFSLKLERHDDDKLAERLRFLILSSAKGASDKVTAYLQRVQNDDRHRGAEYIIENSALLVPHLPSELVDFMLGIMCPVTDDEDVDEWESRSSRMLTQQTLGIDDDRLFFPAAPLRPPFFLLLGSNEEEGLRLINGLCNSAIEVWRSMRRGGSSGTAIPVRMTFSWGDKEFWGHEREYLWFRSLGVGPYSVCSALMALEMWMELEVEKGRDLRELFETVLKDNDCVAALGACIFLILANPQAALDVAIPFATNPYLWDWDLRRTVLEGNTASNLIGFMNPKDRIFAESVLKRNQLAHRKDMLRNIVPLYFLTASSEVQTAFLARMKETVQGDLPYQYEEWRGHEDTEAYLKDQIRRMEAMADPTNYRHYNTDDGRFLFQYEHPDDLAPDAERVEADHAELGQYLRIALWTEKSFETEILQTEINLQDAILKAKEWDEPQLFSLPISFEDMKRQKRAAAVAGVAAILSQYGENLSKDDVEWFRCVLERAAATPFASDTLTMRMSVISFHPALYAVRGLMALVRKGEATQKDKDFLLSLVCHPLEMIGQTLYQETAKCWYVDPDFCWQAFVLAVKLSLMPSSIIPRGHALEVDEAEQKFLEDTLNEVLSDYHKGQLSSLPSIPLEWEEDPTQTPHHAYGQYRRSEILFMWHTPKKSIFLQPVDKIMSDESRKSAVTKLLQDFMAWTHQDCCPPWKDDNRNSGSSAYEWLYAFTSWCAELSLYLSVEETNTLIIDPILEIECRQEENILSNFVSEFVFKHFLQDKMPDEKAIVLWKRLCGVLLNHEYVWRLQRADFLTRHYGESVAFMLFCYGTKSLFQHPWSPVSLFDDEIRKWVEVFGSTKACYGVLISFLQNVGMVYAPEQSINWLSEIAERHKDKASFWSANGNGSETIDYLEKILDNFIGQVQKDPAIIRKIIRIADILTENGIRAAAQIQQRMAKITVAK